MHRSIQQSFYQNKQTHSCGNVIIAHLSIVVVLHTHTRTQRSQVHSLHSISVPLWPVAPGASLCFWERDLSKCRALTHFRGGINSKAKPLSCWNAPRGAYTASSVCAWDLTVFAKKDNLWDKGYVRLCLCVRLSVTCAHRLREVHNGSAPISPSYPFNRLGH